MINIKRYHANKSQVGEFEIGDKAIFTYRRRDAEGYFDVNENSIVEGVGTVVSSGQTDIDKLSYVEVEFEDIHRRYLLV